VTVVELALRLTDQPSWVAMETTDPVTTAEDLALELGETRATLVQVVDLTDSDLDTMERERNRIVGTGSVVFLGTEEQLGRVAARAPHCWSLVGPDYWVIEPGAQLDVAARLADLRAQTGLTDAQVLDAVASGRLPADPLWAEWLALLGRGDLLAP